MHAFTHTYSLCIPRSDGKDKPKPVLTFGEGIFECALFQNLGFEIVLSAFFMKLKKIKSKTKPYP